MTSLHCDVEMKARSTEVEACGAGRYGEKEKLSRQKEEAEKQTSSEEANAQRPTLNAEVAEVRLKAALRVRRG